MKGKMMLEHENHHEHDHDADKGLAKKAPLKAKVMNQKTQKNNVKAHRKAMAK